MVALRRPSQARPERTVALVPHEGCAGGRRTTPHPRRAVIVGPLSTGAALDHDALIVASGARATRAIAGALRFRDQRDVPAFRAILRELDAGKPRRLAFPVPPGPSWPLPAYELALMAAAHAERRCLETEILR